MWFVSPKQKLHKLMHPSPELATKGAFSRPDTQGTKKVEKLQKLISQPESIHIGNGSLTYYTFFDNIESECQSDSKFIYLKIVRNKSIRLKDYESIRLM